MLGKKLFFIKDFLSSANLQKSVSFEDFMKTYTDDKLTELVNSDIFNDRNNKKNLSLILFKIEEKDKASLDEESLDIIFHSIKMEIRDYDILASWSKDEFILLLPECSLENANNIAERISNIIEDFDENKKFNILYGVAEYIEGESKESFIHRAREQLRIPSKFA